MPSPELKTERIKADYEVILKALQKYNFSKIRAAKYLGIDRKTLYNKLRAYQQLFESEAA